jgi:hypothetical protein
MATISHTQYTYSQSEIVSQLFDKITNRRGISPVNRFPLKDLDTKSEHK